MNYTVHWVVNDGRCGYPNIVADLAWSDIFCKSYEEAIRAHAEIKGVRKIISISKMLGKGSKGKINGRNYRDFLVNYLTKGVTVEKDLYISGEVISKTVRVFGSYSGKSASL